MRPFISLILVALLAGCDRCEENPLPKTDIEKLPPATQEGKNTFGCLVNGKAWITRTSIDANAVYQMGALLITGDLREQGREQNIQVNILSSVMVNFEYDLTNVPQCQGKFAWIRDNGICFYEEENTLSGKLLITKLEEEARLVSGTFEFVTVVSECDTIKVTDGRFDLTYAD